MVVLPLASVLSVNLLCYLIVLYYVKVKPCKATKSCAVAKVSASAVVDRKHKADEIGLGMSVLYR